MPDLVIGLAEDALALSAGAAVVGLTPAELVDVGETALSDARQGHLWSSVRQLKNRLVPVS